MKILFLDCFSGISGDMLLGAFIDLGVPATVIEAAIQKLLVPDIRISAKKILKQGIAATHIAFAFPREDVRARSYSDIRGMIQKSDLLREEKEDALYIFSVLAAAESKVHGIPEADVHFHEVGALDSICDIVGAAAARRYLAVEKVFVSSLPIGKGTITCEHGTLPNPAPATAILMAGFSCEMIPYEGEFVTPTGAAIVKAWAVPGEPFPYYTLWKTGYGAGDMDIKGRPNVLRVFLGEKEDETEAEEILWLETDVDDTTPEVLAYVAEELFSRGALDVSSHAITMKKGRIGTRLSAMVLREDRDALCAFLLSETSTLGVRITPVARKILQRETHIITTSLGKAGIKIAHLDPNTRKISPEYEDCVVLARRHNLPLRDVMNLVVREAEKTFNR